jgi:hypothetical protein
MLLLLAMLYVIARLYVIASNFSAFKWGRVVGSFVLAVLPAVLSAGLSGLMQRSPPLCTRCA